MDVEKKMSHYFLLVIEMNKKVTIEILGIALSYDRNRFYRKQWFGSVFAFNHKTIMQNAVPSAPVTATVPDRLFFIRDIYFL